MIYYDVGLGVEKHWDSGIFTYFSETDLKPGAIVKVPFGQHNKIGVVLKKVNKPTFKTKELTVETNIVLSSETLRFIEWYQIYYASRGGQAFSQLLPKYLTKPKPMDKDRKQVKNTETLITPEQKRAKKEITSTKNPTVLHGITGSGKTRIYTSLIIDRLKKGESSLLLYPEIALTPQITLELQKYVDVLVFHSKLTSSQRSKLWFDIANATKPYVLIGARSSLFLPHKNLGLIILDEFHEPAYKQDNDIRYNAVHTAGGLSKIHKAKLLLGSATPPIVETELVLSSGGNLVCIHKKAIKKVTHKTLHIINKTDKSKFKRHNLLSDPLIESIGKSLGEGKQSLIFINRRGTAKLMYCSSCNWQAECPRCDLPATYHHDTHKLICHTCGKNIHIEPSCPECSSSLEFRSFGSKAIYDEIQKLFGGAKIGRYDSDTKKDDSFDSNYEAIRKGEIDIMIGTQQLVKGLDLPLLTTVGIIDADLSLHFPDFSSEERTFQLISQVIGRVGRGHLSGEVFIQTFQVNNPVIQLAKDEQWHSFRDREIKIRKQHEFPPFVFIAKIIFRDKNLQKAMLRAEQSKLILQRQKDPVGINGPLPSYHAKRNGFYYIQLHINSPSRTKLLTSISLLPKDTVHELDPLTLL